WALRCGGARHHPAGALFHPHALYAIRTTRGKFARPPRFHQPGIGARRVRRIRDYGLATGAARQLAPDWRHRQLRPDDALLRHGARHRDAGRPRSPDADDSIDANLPMIRWLLWIVGGLVLGGIVHLATIMVLPRTASRDAYARLAALAPVNGFALLPAPT